MEAKASRRRTTLKDVAAATGVDASTVSRALRNDPRVKEATRKQVQAVAKDLGYSPDPELSALSRYRNHRPQQGLLGTIAWLHDYPEVDGWRTRGITVDYFKHAEEVAKSLGYRFEVHSLGIPDLPPERISKILSSRGIRAILIPMLTKPVKEMDFDWSKFCIVSLTRLLKWPHVHTFSPHRFQDLLRLFRELKNRGYKRPLVLFEERYAMAEHDQLYGAIGMAKLDLFGSGLRYETASKKELPILAHSLIDVHRADVVVSNRGAVYSYLKEKRPDSLGKELGFAAFHILTEDYHTLSGIQLGTEHFVNAAVRFLVDQVSLGNYGIPRYACHSMINSQWHDGNSLRPPLAKTEGGRAN